MILEALQFLSTLAVSPRRHRGEIDASVRLWARARRCAKDWSAHELNCHRAVEAAIAQLPSHRTVAILGSGLLRDISIEALSARFDTVILFDLQHLASIRLWCRARRLSNLVFVHADLSGLGELATMTGTGPDPLAFLDELEGLDIVISANLASQIGVGVKRTLKGAPAGMAETTAARLIGCHLDGLASRKVPALLLTDTSYVVRARDGTSLESADLLLGNDPGPADATWDWRLAPFGEIDKGFEVIHWAMARLIIPQRPAGAPPPLP